VPRPTRARLRLAGAVAILAVGAAMLTVPTAAVSSEPAAFHPQLITVDTPFRSDKERLQTLGLDLTEHAGHDYVEVVVHNQKELNLLDKARFEYEVAIPDLIRRGIQIAEINEAYAARVKRSPLPSGRTSYRTLEDYNAEMTRLAKKHPFLVRKFALKRPTLDGNRMVGIEISQGVRQPNRGEPTFVLLGLHHAREWPSGELAMEFAVDLVKHFGKNKRITRLLRQARVVVVPVSNPDGFDLSRTDGEYVDLRELNPNDPLSGSTSVLATPGQAYKRKNCRAFDGQDIPDGSCRASGTSNGGFGIGVDLNRNYGGFWGGPGAAPTEPNPSTLEAGPADPTYRGASAFSEPETKNIHDLIASRQTTMMISNHTFSNLVLRPNGVNPNTIAANGKPVGDSPDERGLKRLGARMAAQNGYANIHGWQLYDTTGTTEDWSYNATGGYGYTFEIGPNEFHPPYPQVVDEYLGKGKYAGKGNREAYLIALEHAVDTRYSGVLRGKAPRGATIRLKKTFRTPTWESSFKDGVNTAITAGREGIEWIVNPSTRPVVRSHPYEDLSDKPFRKKVIQGGPIEPSGHVDHPFVLRRPADVFRTSLDWPTPDDLDLEVYRKTRDGKLKKVGSSGNFVGDKERVDINGAAAGTYVLRVINFASVSPSYTLTEELFNSVTRHTRGKRERYTLTCEKNGTVLQTDRVYIPRGGVKWIDFSECRRKF
jgi:Zinc carboxypeptidase